MIFLIQKCKMDIKLLAKFIKFSNKVCIQQFPKNELLASRILMLIGDCITHSEMVYELMQILNYKYIVYINRDIIHINDKYLKKIRYYRRISDIVKIPSVNLAIDMQVTLQSIIDCPNMFCLGNVLEQSPLKLESLFKFILNNSQKIGKKWIFMRGVSWSY